jgi:hypothetical protein
MNQQALQLAKRQEEMTPRVMASGQPALEFISSGISLLSLEPSALEQLEILPRGALMQ